jgi:hypothetical protein
MKKEVGHHIKMASNACRVLKIPLIMLCIPSGYGMGHLDRDFLDLDAMQSENFTRCFVWRVTLATRLSWKLKTRCIVDI